MLFSASLLRRRTRFLFSFWIYYFPRTSSQSQPPSRATLRVRGIGNEIHLRIRVVPRALNGTRPSGRSNRALFAATRYPLYARRRTMTDKIWETRRVHRERRDSWHWQIQLFHSQSSSPSSGLTAQIVAVDGLDRAIRRRRRACVRVYATPAYTPTRWRGWMNHGTHTCTCIHTHIQWRNDTARLRGVGGYELERARMCDGALNECGREDARVLLRVAISARALLSCINSKHIIQCSRETFINEHTKKNPKNHNFEIWEVWRNYI